VTVSIFGRFSVKEFDQFKQVFDQGTEIRQQLGVISQKVLRDRDDPNTVMIWYEYEDVEKAKAYVAMVSSEQFLKSPPVKQGGVLPKTAEMWLGIDA
jgi:quinol monooxygenase YgiN